MGRFVFVGTCPACGHDAPRRTGSHWRPDLRTPTLFHLVTCGACGDDVPGAPPRPAFDPPRPARVPESTPQETAPVAFQLPLFAARR